MILYAAAVILKPGHSTNTHFKAPIILLKKGGTTFFDRRNGFLINRPDREKSLILLEILSVFHRVLGLESAGGRGEECCVWGGEGIDAAARHFYNCKECKILRWIFIQKFHYHHLSRCLYL